MRADSHLHCKTFYYEFIALLALLVAAAPAEYSISYSIFMYVS